MRLKSGFVTRDVDDTQFLVPVGSDAFSGVLRSNSTAAFIINLLKEDTTEEKITDALWEVYDAPRERIAEDVRKILLILRDVHALEEDS